MNENIIKEFIENIKICSRCPGSDEGCEVCGQWVPYTNYWNMPEYKIATKFCATIETLTDVITEEKVEVEFKNIFIYEIKVVKNGIEGTGTYDRTTGNDDLEPYFVQFRCKL